ncbi:hypothetical protein CLCR_09007 [Cladophialophora carrionii]|uniref:Uncharacterized protein n=1 Tax=Cladophialophora carrionii TaxID=86049 RepID=A0A1C1CUF2_9EURO|nr:hypothetical protein CLCR_09007 [Cladophialophora carrionii]
MSDDGRGERKPGKEGGEAGSYNTGRVRPAFSSWLLVVLKRRADVFPGAPRFFTRSVARTRAPSEQTDNDQGREGNSDSASVAAHRMWTVNLDVANYGQRRYALDLRGR